MSRNMRRVVPKRQDPNNDAEPIYPKQVTATEAAKRSERGKKAVQTRKRNLANAAATTKAEAAARSKLTAALAARSYLPKPDGYHTKELPQISSNMLDNGKGTDDDSDNEEASSGNVPHNDDDSGHESQSSADSNKAGHSSAVRSVCSSYAYTEALAQYINASMMYSRTTF